MSKNISNEKNLPRGVMKLPNGTYRGRFKYCSEKYSLNRPDLKTLLEDMEEMKYQVKHGIKGKGDNLTLNEWQKLWLFVHKKPSIKESTLVRYDDMYHRYVAERFGKRRIADFRPIVFEQLYQELAKKQFASKTIKDLHCLLHSMFQYAMHNRLITFNPCDGVSLPKTDRKKIRVLSITEQSEVLRHSQNRWLENLVIVALNTGLRSGELRSLMWTDIDFEKREIYVNKTLVYIKDPETTHYVFKIQSPKTSNSYRSIPMQECVYEALKRQQSKIKEMQQMSVDWCPQENISDLVFCSQKGKPLSERQLQITLDSIEKAINNERMENARIHQTDFIPIPHFYPHALRHTFATRCFEAGIAPKTLQYLMGHYSVSITLDLYTHITDDKARLEMNKLENYCVNL